MVDLPIELPHFLWVLQCPEKSFEFHSRGKTQKSLRKIETIRSLFSYILNRVSSFIHDTSLYTDKISSISVSPNRANIKRNQPKHQKSLIEDVTNCWIWKKSQSFLWCCFCNKLVFLSPQCPKLNFQSWMKT